MQSSPHQIQNQVQITEDTLPLVYYPIEIGNETYVVVEQDIKKIEEKRILSYYKYESDGQQPVNLNHFCDIQNKQTKSESRTTTTSGHEEDVWNNLVQALFAAHFSKLSSYKKNMVSKLLEVINTFESSEPENSPMEWEEINPEHSTNHEPCFRNVRFEDDINDFSTFSSSYSHGPFDKNSFLNNKDKNFRDTIYQKKKKELKF